MMDRYVFEAVDRMLRDIMAPVMPWKLLGERPFGGKVVVMGGDFRQILPVVPRGRKADVIAATLNQSQLIWGFVRVFKLHANMRVQRLLDAGGPDAEGNAAVQQSFASFLKSLGNGTALVYPDRDEGEDVIRFPPEMCCDGDTLEDLIKEVYGDLAAFTDAVAATGPITGWQLVVIGAVGEEGDSPGARYVAPLYRPAYSIIGEPSHWQRLTLGYKGSARTELTVRRSRSHTAGGNESACEAVIKAWEMLGEWAAAFNTGRERSFDQVQLTLIDMDSGGTGFEEWARLRLVTRLPSDLPPEKWYPRLYQIPAIVSTPGLTLEPVGFPLPAFQGGKNTLLVRAFLAGIRAAGGQPGFNLKTGTSDINLVAPLWGCPALAYGPGDSTLDHTPGENLALEEYQHAVDVLQLSLKRLCEANDLTTALR